MFGYLLVVCFCLYLGWYSFVNCCVFALAVLFMMVTVICLRLELVCASVFCLIGLFVFCWFCAGFCCGGC